MVHVVCLAAIVRLAEDFAACRSVAWPFLRSWTWADYADPEIVGWSLPPPASRGARATVGHDTDEGPAGSGSGHGLSNARDLIEVQQVVAGIETPEAFEAFLATLAVNAVWIGVVVAQPRRPQVLVAACGRRPVLRQDQPQAPGPDDVGVGEVLEDLSDRPLARAFRLPQLRGRHAFNRAPQGSERLAQDAERIAIAEQVEHGARVGAACSAAPSDGLVKTDIKAGVSRPVSPIELTSAFRWAAGAGKAVTS
jgi:hypothetical protein